MRRWMKERWRAELALVAALGALAFLAHGIIGESGENTEARPEERAPAPVVPPEVPPIERARMLRADALGKCDAADWEGCLGGLDQAASIDPIGDEASNVQQARDKARDGIEPKPVLEAPKPPEARKPAPRPVVQTKPKMVQPHKGKSATPTKTKMAEGFLMEVGDLIPDQPSRK